MAKIDIIFNNSNYTIDESALQNATDALKSHLSTVMSGSGAKITIGGTTYNVDATKLATATNAFVAHLGTISGNGYKVVVGGAEYSVDSSKMTGAIGELETVLGGLNSGGNGGWPYEPITWDGNKDGLELFDAGGAVFVKIADYVELTDGSQVESVYVRATMDGQVMETTQPGGAMIDPSGNGWTYSEILVASNGNLLLGEYTVPSGVWHFDILAVAPYTDYYIAINPATPSSAGSDTLTWDGNTEGLVSVMGMFYHVSDAVPTMADFANGFTMTMISDGETISASETAEEAAPGLVCIIYGGAPNVFVVPSDGYSADGIVFPKKGVYFANNTVDVVTSLTIHGYTGF